MKKFAIGCLITAGVMAVLGIILCGICLFFGGRQVEQYVTENSDKIVDAADRIEDAAGHMAGGAGSSAAHAISHFLRMEGHLISEDVDWDEYDEKVTVHKESHGEKIAADQIRNLELELGAGEFIIEEKAEADQVMELIIEGYGNCAYSNRDGTLCIKGFQDKDSLHHRHNDNLVVIRLPKGFSFDEAELTLGAGIMDVKFLTAKEAELEVGAGELTIGKGTIQELEAQVDVGTISAQNLDVRNAEISVGMGECIFKGSISGNLEAKCSMGNLEMELEGTEQEHNYVLDCDMGNISIGGIAFGGLSSEKKIDNNADSTFEIECNMGNITICFVK